MSYVTVVLRAQYVVWKLKNSPLIRKRISPRSYEREGKASKMQRGELVFLGLMNTGHNYLWHDTFVKWMKHTIKKGIEAVSLRTQYILFLSQWSSLPLKRGWSYSCTVKGIVQVLRQETTDSRERWQRRCSGLVLKKSQRPDSHRKTEINWRPTKTFENRLRKPFKQYFPYGFDFYRFGNIVVHARCNGTVFP